MPISVETEMMQGIGDTILTIANMMPDVSWGACDTGSDQLTARIEGFNAPVSHALIGGAAEVYNLGRTVIDSAAAYISADN